MAKQERAVRTRETLIRCAAEIFDREGFTVASLTTISTQAGVSNGALHFHFASKAALADAVEDAALERLRAIGDEASPQGAGWLQHLVDVTHGLARGLREDVVLRAGFVLSGDTARPSLTNLRLHWQRWVEQAVARADGAGELRAGVAPESAAATVVAATVGFEVLCARDAQWISPQTVTGFWQLLLPSLASPELLNKLEADGSSPMKQTGWSV
ncbi:ScbR family autoregulator-binding transcription factor [Streptomyces sp. NBC_01408]|uniref:ScbR family autoregulator-binding transcription factor n=1 Tax=Streptomyces sp. NBC_01408 TaxID=2903855 RepID=UPI002252F601|nr:ScbR family autoregulator-binding transcription factor [Streptomyces sp. NBC_01408]MCX4696864.1 ScbR family autoregulator-binding transcription factor [Streptomyces sp. NBC_01408]